MIVFDRNRVAAAALLALLAPAALAAPRPDRAALRRKAEQRLARVEQQSAAIERRGLHADMSIAEIDREVHGNVARSQVALARQFLRGGDLETAQQLLSQAERSLARATAAEREK
jgi:hypothetical protein